MSLEIEDLRDQYKSSRQSSDHKLKLNGATYSKLHRNVLHAKGGNTIKLTRVGEYCGDELMDELNEKYQIDCDSTFSLNKKKRWELSKEIVRNISNFEKDDVDLRLYETRNRNEKKSNCIAVHKSMGDKVEVKKTFANLASIKKV